VKTTRMMAVAGAVLIAGGGLTLNVAQSQQPGIKRTDLLRYELSVPGTRSRPGARRFRPGVAFPRTAIRAKRSPMSSKVSWSIGSRASRR
jgi:hypothetical protein